MATILLGHVLHILYNKNGILHVHAYRTQLLKFGLVISIHSHSTPCQYSVCVNALTESIPTNIFMICSVYGSILLERARHKSPTRPTVAKHT